MLGELLGIIFVLGALYYLGLMLLIVVSDKIDEWSK